MSNERNSREPVDPMELWEKWYETAARGWSNIRDDSKENYMDPYVFYRNWMKSVGKAQELMQEQLKACSFGTMDPREAWKRWFETMTDMLEKSSEEFFSNLQLPTRSDIARVAELVIEVENKVESIEDALESFEDNYARAIPDNLKERLEQVERKIDALPGTFQKLTTVDGLEKRLDRVENKLDKLLVALEKIKVKELPKSSGSPNPNSNKVQAARRESSKG